MKKILMFVAVVGLLASSVGSAFADSRYTCYRHHGGTSHGSIEVRAGSEGEAEKKAYERFKEMGYQIDRASCSLAW